LLKIVGPGQFEGIVGLEVNKINFEIDPTKLKRTSLLQ
jgi:hypothetical protein